MARTLGTFARPESAAVLLPLLDDESWIVRAHAARVAPLLADEQWWVRLAAREALVAMGAETSTVLVAYLEHEDRFARNGAAEVLQNLGWLDEVLELAVEDGAASEAGGLVKKALTAGGEGMAGSYVMRQSEELQPRVVELMRSLGLEPAVGV